MTLESSGGKHHLGGMKNLLVSPPCGRSGQPGLLAGSTTSASGLSVESAISGATIFMTGSTGFVGSVVLEQLMRSCPTFKRIYLLIRARRGQQGEQRLSQLLAKDLFHLHWKDGAVPLDVRNKIAVIAGDMHAPGLGLSDADKQRLLAEVDCVIHCAASISFFEPVHTLLEQNYEATRKTAELAQQMRHLRGFVYVSTAYVNSNLPRGSHIEERIYPLYYSNGNRILHGHLAAQLAALPASKAERLAQDVLRQTALPNCYTLTKHMCEEMLVGLHGVAFPVAIVRPTIVGAVARLPLPGYFGNAAGITSATLAFATGMSRFCCHNPHSVYDVVPCDLTASTILVAAAALQEACVSGAAQPLVLHSGTSCTHPFSYYAMHATVVFPYWSACPPDRRLCSKPYKPIDHPTNFVPERSMIFRAMTLKHNIRIWLVAAGLQVAGQRKTAGLVRASWRVWKLYNTSTMDFHLFYCSRNLVELQGLIKTSEQESWQLVWGPGDDWEKYLLTHMRAIRAKYFPLRAPKEADTPESSAASVVKVQ